MSKKKKATEKDIDVNNNAQQEAEVAEKETQQEPTLEEQLQQKEEELASAKDQNLRLYAEFENFKRRTAKERLELMNSANIEVMQALLPVVDDFERALKNIERTDENKNLFEGVELIYNKLSETLKQKGLKPMENATGKKFDVETMEAITKLPVPDAEQHNQVVDEVERGYHLGDKVLRYARVVVANHAESNG